MESWYLFAFEWFILKVSKGISALYAVCFFCLAGVRAKKLRDSIGNTCFYEKETDVKSTLDMLKGKLNVYTVCGY